MKYKVAGIAAVAAAGLVVVYAQTPAPSAAASLKAAYTRIKTNFVKAAEKMPEENYSFKPVDALETFGGRVAHIADPQLTGCTGMTGERKDRNGEVEDVESRSGCGFERIIRCLR